MTAATVSICDAVPYNSKEIWVLDPTKLAISILAVSHATATMATSTSRTDLIRNTAESFCKAFVSGASPTQTLNEYFTSDPSITEHGPLWASERLPFLAKTFRGRRQQDSNHGLTTSNGLTCDDYYDLLTSTLSFHPNEETVPPIDSFVVDADAKSPNGNKGTVTIKLQAEFKSIKTGRGWKEEFVYVLSDFDEEGRIGTQELWADPLSAWMAVGD